MTLTQLPTLFKKATGGATQQWRIWVTPEQDGTALIHVEYGQVGGKLQTQTERITEGKNAGRRNATTPIEQAQAEAAAEWTKKRDRKHYGLAVEESAEKRGLAPMLAKVYEKEVAKVQWDAAFEQAKLDGFRCLATRIGDTVEFLSREGKTFALPHIEEALLSVLQEGERFDGELYLHGTPLNTIASWVKKLQPDTKQILYNVYDAPIAAPFAERISFVQRRLGRTRQVGNVVMVETVPVRDEEALLAMQAKRLEEGYEGSMLRYGDLPYQAGKRASCLLKVKVWRDAEFPITGVQEGRGTCAGMAIFQCRTPAGHVFDVLAPGTHEAKRSAWVHQAEWLGRQLTVRYAYMTKTEQPVPWHPVAKGLATPITG